MQTAVLPPAPAAVPPEAFAPLDEPAEWQGFSRQLAGRGGAWESWLAVTGMHCAGCALNVEAALARLPGVASVEVNGPAALARIVWTPGLTRPSAWLAALARAGYGALPAGDVLDAQPRRTAARLMLWRWLVAGFCMMQVMMYAFPAYIAEPGEITPDIQALLLWASWILTLPVVLFCCQPFFASALRDLRQRRIGMDVPVALGVLIAFVASTASTFGGSGAGGEVWFDSVTMFVFFLLSGRLLELRLRDQTAGALEALMRRLPASVERKAAGGVFERVPVRRLAFGDLIRVLPGEVIPADGVVEAGSSRVDEALLTGESTPLLRVAGTAVVAGSHNLSGPLEVRVMRIGRQTRYAEIVALMQQASLAKPRLAQLADRIASPFLLLVLLAAAGAAAWWWPAGPSHAIGVAVAVLIVTCPCALSLATPAATLASAAAMARRGVLLRRLQALEACAAIDTVLFDKTGTLTSDRIAAGALTVRAGADSDKVGRQAAALAGQSLHPASRAVAAGFQPGPWSCAEAEEVAGSGVRGLVRSPASPVAAALRLGSALFCGAPEADGRAGMRVHLADDAGWLASIDLDETLRPDAADAVLALRELGVAVRILSGDRTEAVAAVAGRAGIADFRGGCTPQDKLEQLERLQQQGHRVAMVGDGMNDGPALARADVSVAVGDAVPLAQAQADAVIPGAQLVRLALLLRHARATRRVVRQNLAWAALYNAVCVPLAIAGAMPPWLAGLGMAASSLLVVFNSARLARLSA